MSRRNTIIIAVLVNAGLLLVLFATAMRSKDKEEAKVELAKTPAQKESQAPVTTEELLNEYIAQTAIPQEDVIVMEGAADTVAIEVPQVPADSSVAPVAQEATPSLPAQTPVVQAPSAQPKPVVVQAQAQTQTQVASSAREQMLEVTVKKGEYLEKIAKANNTTVNAIMKANNLATTQLKIGQVLKIPSGVKEKSETTAPKIEGDYYIVKEGDSPWIIANKCNVKLDELLRLNNIDDQRAKKIRPGEKLRIR